MKKLRILAALCAALLLVAVIPLTRARADFGDYSGDSDYGDSDYGGSDTYWDDSDSSRSYSSDGESSPGEMAAGIIIFVILVIFFFIGKKKGTAAGGTRSGPQAAGVARSALQPIASYSSLDPAFSPSATEAKIANLYIQMQNCWQARDISPLRPYLSNMFFEQADRQLGAHRSAKRTNYVKNPTVLGVTLLGWRQEGGLDLLYAEVRARIIDYTLDDATGRLLSGSMTAEKFMTYEWELVRPSGQTTRAPGEMTTISCPHCGAPVNINQSAKCEYCGSVLTVDRYDFVLNRISATRQETR